MKRLNRNNYVDVLKYAFVDHELARTTALPDELKYESSVLYCYGTMWHAALMSILFVPKFKLIRGCIFLYTFHESPEFDAEREALLLKLEDADDKTWTDEVSNYNWIELEAAIIGSYGPQTEGDDGEFAVDEFFDVVSRAMMRSWSGILKTEYPDHQVTVRILPPEEVGANIGVGFSQRRPRRQT